VTRPSVPPSDDTVRALAQTLGISEDEIGSNIARAREEDADGDARGLRTLDG
jgi:hypothetical protein